MEYTPLPQPEPTLAEELCGFVTPGLLLLLVMFASLGSTVRDRELCLLLLVAFLFSAWKGKRMFIIFLKGFVRFLKGWVRFLMEFAPPQPEPTLAEELCGFATPALLLLLVTFASLGRTVSDRELCLLLLVAFLFSAWKGRRMIIIFLWGFVRFLKGLAAFLTGLGCVVTVLAMWAKVIDDLNSFMTAPIGTKPDHVYNGWGEGWWVYGLTSAGMWLAYKGLKWLLQLATDNSLAV